MTATRAGKLAADGLWSSLKRLRDQWVLLVFLATALFWTRDFYETLVDLPARVQEQRKVIDQINVAISRLEQKRSGPLIDRAPALKFPGSEHGIEDGRPGSTVIARLIPTDWLRAECTATGLAAFMVDASGKWYSVETTLVRLPQLFGSQKLAFGVTVHPEMLPGRAEFLVEFRHDCGTHIQVDTSPRLPFRVLSD